jgi:hypothetical protein
MKAFLVLRFSNYGLCDWQSEELACLKCCRSCLEQPDILNNGASGSVTSHRLNEP